MLSLKREVVVDRGGLLHIHLSPSELCSKHTDIYDAMDLLTLKRVMVFERGVCSISIFIHVHLLNCVHNYTDIYDGMELLALNGVVADLIYIHHDLWIVFTDTHTFMMP